MANRSPAGLGRYGAHPLSAGRGPDADPSPDDARGATALLLLAADGGSQGNQLLAKLAEFVMPKLARTELSGELDVRGRLVIKD